MARSTRVMFAAGRVPARIRAVEPNVDLVLRVAFEVLLVGLVLWWWIFLGLHTGSASWGFDFRQFWQGGNDVVNGISPYPSPALLATAGDHLDALGIREVFRFPYPAGAAVALAPFGALSFGVAVAV